MHRAIRYAITSGKPSGYSYTPTEMANMAVHCSQRERRAEEAERDVDERFKCAWMSKHVGSEFEGIVTGVTSFGLFVELDESKVSGLVHISQLSNDYYHFDPVRHLLKGERTGAQHRLGDHVRIQVLRASLEDRKIDFRLVSPRAEAKPTGSERRYDYAAAGERYSLPAGRKATARPGSRDNAGTVAPRAAATTRKDAPAADRHPPAGKSPAAGQSMFSKVKSAAQGKFKAVKAAASKATSRARKGSKKKG